MNQPLVSIIMPSYNHGRYIGYAIESVLNQSFSDFELIIIDDFSKDKSVELIKNYQKKDTRVAFLFHDRNKGIAKTLNDGLMLAKGKYIAIIASDDIWKENKLETQLEIFNKNPNIGAIHTNAELINGIGQPIVGNFKQFAKRRTDQYSGNLLDALTGGNFICGSSLIFKNFRCNNYNQILFKEDFKYLNDWMFFIEMAKIYLFYYIEDNLVKYRRSETNTSWDSFGYIKDLVKITIFLLINYDLSNFQKIKLIHYFQRSIPSLIIQWFKYKYNLSFKNRT